MDPYHYLRARVTLKYTRAEKDIGQCLGYSGVHSGYSGMGLGYYGVQCFCFGVCCNMLDKTWVSKNYGAKYFCVYL